MSIRHSPGCHVFLADVDDRLGYLQYERIDGWFVIEHTFVPPNGRGRGVGEALVRAAVEEAQRTHQRMSFRCPFAAAVARRNGWLEEPDRLQAAPVIAAGAAVPLAVYQVLDTRGRSCGPESPEGI